MNVICSVLQSNGTVFEYCIDFLELHHKYASGNMLHSDMLLWWQVVLDAVIMKKISLGRQCLNMQSVLLHCQIQR